jgi:EAL domain-containing protein (putative c-di-GMP-specific phosphodiesterase class I)
VAQVEDLVQRHLDDSLTRKLVFEITESIVAEDIHRVILIMNQLKTLGIRFSMDDFGTGYSSLSYLNRLPLDEIKIDRAFVSALGQNEGDRAMVITILNMAHILKLNIVAEGVETDAQLDFLLHHGCQIFQGYYYSKPLPNAQFAEYYRAQPGMRALA